MKAFNLFEKLKKARTDAGFTQKEVYEKLGVPQSTFSSWEVGKSEPDAETLIKLCVTYGISDFSYFTNEKNNATKDALTLAEQAHIKKYRVLDEHGKDMVDVVLEKESERVEAEKAVRAGAYDDDPDELRELPLYDIGVAAGIGVFLDSDSYELVQVGDEVPASANYGVWIRGDSMEPDYPDGWIAWVKQCITIELGQVGIFVVNGGDRYIKQLGRNELISLNPLYKPIKLYDDDGDRCYGLVVGVSEGVY